MMVLRRAGGEPVHRIIGRREFHGHFFDICADVLDPRPETELLVEHVIAGHVREAELHFADIGTGSGAIGISLLKAFRFARCCAIDISKGALDQARHNAKLHGVEDRFHTVQSNYLAGIGLLFDFIVSNPPYIRSGDIDGLDREVRLHDPRSALDGGVDGLDAYRVILGQASTRLRTGGRLYLEIGSDQLEMCSELAYALGWRVIFSQCDYANLPRLLVLEPDTTVHKPETVHDECRKCLESPVETDSFPNVQGQRP
jgi:release factor glutamine methyltransferase